MAKITSCVSICKSHQAAVQGLMKLQARNFDLCQISLVGKGYHTEEHPIGFYNAGDGIHFLGLQAAFWDSMCDRLAGAGFFWIPGFGTLVAAGPIVTRLVKGPGGVALGDGFGVLGAALYSIGIPRKSITRYEKVIRAEKFLLIVYGDRCDVERACEILHCQEQQVAVHIARPVVFNQSDHNHQAFISKTHGKQSV